MGEEAPKIEDLMGNNQPVYREECSLYRWEEDHWELRGNGFIQIFVVSSKGYVLVEQVMSKKVLAYFCVSDTCQLIPHAGGDRAWVWNADNLSGESVVSCRFAVRFNIPSRAQQFKEAFENTKTKKTEEEN